MLALLLALATTFVDDPPSPAAQVLRFARENVGQRVGDGDCASLVHAALDSAGAGYDDGDEVPSLRDLRPGDILEFDGAVLSRRRTRPDGAVLTTTATLAHHLAIVSAARRSRGVLSISILHQNVTDEGPGVPPDLVREWTFRASDLKRGTLRAFRPQVPSPGEDARPSR